MSHPSLSTWFSLDGKILCWKSFGFSGAARLAVPFILL
jgi:hypothetical protein